MAIAAQPSDIMRVLKRRKARGQTVEPYQFREALRSYWDVQAARRQQDRALGLRNKALALEEDRLDIMKKREDAAEDAAKIQGLAEIGSTAAMGAMALKGTRLGAKIGLGGPTETTTGAATASTITPSGAAVGESATGGIGGATTYSSAGLETTAPSIGGTAVGIGAGMVGGKIAGKAITGSESGGAFGTAVGGGIGGFAAGGPYGAVIGFVLGGKKEEEDDSDTVYDENLDGSKHPEVRAKINQILGAKKK